MVEPLRHHQTKEAATDMFSLQPPRHISTLPKITVRRRAIDGELAPESDKSAPKASAAPSANADLAVAVGASYADSSRRRACVRGAGLVAGYRVPGHVGTG